MPTRKAHKRVKRQDQALIRQDIYDTLTLEEKKAKSEEWKKNSGK